MSFASRLATPVEVTTPTGNRFQIVRVDTISLLAEGGRDLLTVAARASAPTPSAPPPVADPAAIRAGADIMRRVVCAGVVGAWDTERAEFDPIKITLDEDALTARPPRLKISHLPSPDTLALYQAILTHSGSGEGAAAVASLFRGADGGDQAGHAGAALPHRPVDGG